MGRVMRIRERGKLRTGQPLRVGVTRSGNDLRRRFCETTEATKDNLKAEKR